MSDPIKEKLFPEESRGAKKKKRPSGEVRGRKASDETREKAYLQPVLKKIKEGSPERQKSPPLKRKIVKKEIPEVKQSSIASKIADCFGKKVERVKEHIEIKGLFLTLSTLATERLRKPKTLKRKEVIQIYTLFFKSACANQSQACLDKMQNPVKPDPAFVFHSLFQCMSNLDEAGGFDKAKGTAKALVATRPKPGDFKHLRAQKWPTLAQYLNMGSEQKQFYDEKYSACLDSDNQKIREFGRAFFEAKGKYFDALEAYQGKLKRLGLVEIKDLYGHSTNVNETYLFGSNKYQWICKPVGGAHRYPLAPKAEWCASLVNAQCEFPIPLTLKVELEAGVKASLQFYVQNTVNLKVIREETKSKFVLNDLKRIMLFDFLFTNEDRHVNNILFCKLEEALHVFGIDHDQCFMLSKLTGAFNRECIGLIDESETFSEEILLLISEENVLEYIELMHKAKVSKDSIQWMQFAAEFIRTNTDWPIGELYDKLEAHYKERIYGGAY